MKAKITRYLIPLLILTIIITFCSSSCSPSSPGDQKIEEPAQETIEESPVEGPEEEPAEEVVVDEPVEEPEPDIALEIVELAKSQIGKLTGDGPFASLIWADSEITYCDRFVSAVMAVASGKPLSERKSYPTAYDDYIAHEGLIKSGEPPKGAVVYYGKHKENWNCGHVGISDGEGNIISVVNKTKGVDITPRNYFRAPLLGWVTFKEYKSQEEVVEEVINETWEEEALDESEAEEMEDGEKEEPSPGNFAPVPPSLLFPYRPSGDSIVSNEPAQEGTFVFKDIMMDAEGDNVKLQIELRPLNESFTGIPNYESNWLKGYNEFPLETPPDECVWNPDYQEYVASISVYITEGTYHWQLRAIDEHGAASSWSSFDNIADEIGYIYLEVAQ